MTGYGRGDCSKDGFKITVELSSVNRKQTEISVNLPREMELLAKEIEPYAHERWLVSSDPDEHVEQIAPYLEYGFTHLVFHFPGDDQDAAIARYGEQILPRLRARFG